MDPKDLPLDTQILVRCHLRSALRIFIAGVVKCPVCTGFKSLMVLKPVRVLCSNDVEQKLLGVLSRHLNRVAAGAWVNQRALYNPVDI